MEHLKHKTKEELIKEIEKLQTALDRSYNRMNLLSKGNLPVLSESLQDLYFGIANLAIKSVTLEQLFQEIHDLLKKFIDVNNFHVALYDNKKTLLNFPYYIDEQFKGLVTTSKRKIGKGLTEYNLQLNKPLFLYEEQIIELTENNQVEFKGGRIPKIWMGVPLKLESETIGLIAIKSYNHRNKYNLKHLEMLHFVSGQIALAIERKRNEEKINFQNARMKAIFESSSHLMWSANRKLILTSFNHNYLENVYKQHGTYPQLNVMPKGGIKLFLGGENYSNFVLKKYQQAFEGKPQNFEVSNVLPYGKLIWWEIFLNPIFLNDGTIEEVSGIAHDITQKKRAEMALLESEEKFRNIFESFQDIYYRTDVKGNINMISPSVYEMTGFKPEEIIGKSITEFYERPPENTTVIRTLLQNGSVRNVETSIKTRYGNIIQTISNIRVIYDAFDRPIGVEGVARDITYLKSAQEEMRNAKDIAERSLKVKQLFLANMSHEIRTPMNGIIGMIDLLSSSKLNDEQKDYMLTIRKSSETLLNILNDILDLSKLEAGKMQLRPSAISLETTLDKLYSLFTNLARSKGISLEYSIAEDVPLYIKADETRLIQILSNLTSNAIKFTDKGGVTIFAKKAGKKRIKVVIQDSGIGITKENVRLLFDAFSQLDNTSSKSYGGTGLGLAISKQLCKLMGGNIGVKSKLGEGSTFWFTFEAVLAERMEVVKSISQNENFEIEQFESIHPRILLVDDNQVNQKVAGEILKKSGCLVDFATNGMEAIIKVIENSYDLIFMDIQMPEMDGVTATRKIRELRIKNLAPVVAMTAYSMEEDKERFLNAGMDDYISKPIKAEIIISKIKKWVLKEQEEDIGGGHHKYTLHIVNTEVAEQLKKHVGEEMIADVYEEFEQETITLLEDCSKGDWDTIRGHLHTLKGNAGTLGIDKLASITAKVEGDLKQKNTSHFETDFFTLMNAFKEFQSYYKRILNINSDVRY